MTKFQIPDLPPRLVVRSRLDDRLASWAAARLILVRAPAGYGKTTQTGSWAHRHFPVLQPVLAAGPAVAAPVGPAGVMTAPAEPSATPDHRLGWISLDEHDNDPQQFARCLAAVLEPIIPVAAAAAQQMLASAHLSAANAVGVLVNALAQVPGHVLLAMDDYHVIEEPAVHTLVQTLLDRGPANLHCLLITRRLPPLPISRYRGRSQLLDLRVEDLKFTAAEAQQFFLGALPAALCTEQNLAALAKQTDGWGAGMQLAALALSERGGSYQPALPAGHELLAEYVITEILDHQPAAVRRFMLETAILGQLTAALCRAVTGQADSAERLDFLAHTIGLVTIVDARQGIYRYHSVLRDVLAQQAEVRLRPAAVQELHRRAAAWYAEQGAVDQALHHYRAAGDQAAAIELVEGSFLSLLQRGDILTARHWLAQLPADAALDRPRLALDTAWLSLTTEYGDLTEKVAQARRVVQDAAPDDAARSGWQMELLGLDAGEAFLRGDMARAHELSLRGVAHERALSLSGLAPRLHQQDLGLGLCHLIEGTLHLYTGPLELINQHSEAADAAYARAGHVVGRMSAQRYRAVCLAEGGQPTEAILSFQRLVEFARTAGLSHFSRATETHLYYGIVLYNCNQLDEAREQFEAALAVARLLNDPGWMMWSSLWIKRCDAALQPWQPPDPSEWDEEEKLWRQLSGRFSRVIQLQVTHTRALRWLAVGDGVHAWKVVTSALFNPDSAPNLWHMRYFLTYVSAYLARGKSAAALVPIFHRWEAVANANSWSVPMAIDCGLAAARLSAAQGNHTAAVKRLDDALPLVAASGYVRLVLDQLEPLRPLLPRCRTPIAQQILEEADAAGRQRQLPQLSDIELNVLRLAATDRKRQEIAAELYVSESTIKFHLRRIYARLGVANREAAVTRAKELGIL